jgi:hypothetical protein
VLTELQLRNFECIVDELTRRTRSPLDLDGVCDALITSCFETFGRLSERLRREILSYLQRFQQPSEWDHTEPFAILVRSFDRARMKKEIHGYDPRELARDVISMIYGFVIADPGDLDAAAHRARRVMRLFLEGLRATARSAAVPQRTRGAA